jgi:hypothetical protein
MRQTELVIERTQTSFSSLEFPGTLANPLLQLRTCQHVIGHVDALKEYSFYLSSKIAHLVTMGCCSTISRARSLADLRLIGSTVSLAD